MYKHFWRSFTFPDIFHCFQERRPGPTKYHSSDHDKVRVHRPSQPASALDHTPMPTVTKCLQQVITLTVHALNQRVFIAVKDDIDSVLLTQLFQEQRIPGSFSQADIQRIKMMQCERVQVEIGELICHYSWAVSLKSFS